MKATRFVSGLLTVLLLAATQLPAQTFKVIYNFTNSPDGANPFAGLAISGSTLYGTTSNGGTSSNGTVFRVNTDGGGYTVLKSFSALSVTGTNDGAWPQASLVSDGSALYGTTRAGGAYGQGTVFRISTDGSDYSVLKSFSVLAGNNINNDGAWPYAGLLLSGSTLYGTTFGGGTN